MCIDLLRRRRTRGETAGGRDDDRAVPALIQNDEPESIVTARRLMAALDPAARRLAVLYFVDQLTQDEMAAEMGLSRRTIGKYLKKLSARAKALLAEKGTS